MPVVVGAGGHAKVVLDALLAGGVPRGAIAVRDGDPARAGSMVLGFTVAHPERPEGGEPVHIAIGNNAARARLGAAADALATVVHPRASIAPSARIGAGCFVAARAVVGPDAELGQGVIVNHGAIVDHDCVVGDYAHVAPGATLGGGVTVGARTLIGANAVVLPGVRIGDDAIVGAGAVVLAAIGGGETWAGNPASKRG